MKVFAKMQKTQDIQISCGDAFMTPQQDWNDSNWIKGMGEQQNPREENRIQWRGKLITKL